MPPAPDHYKTLGVPRDSSADQIRAAYRRLARELHPDVNKSPDAAKRFVEVQKAYDVLSDEQTRRHYDRFGDAEPTFDTGAAAPGRGTYTWTNVAGRPGRAGDFNEFDVGSIFEEVFGGGDPFAAGPSARTRSARGRDIEHEIVLDFMEAIRGGVKSIRLQRGSSTKTIELTIPQGVAEGTRLRMRGAGASGSGRAPPGDLLVTVHVAPHELFRREGLDILLDLPLTIAEATLGAAVSVPTLTGRAELAVPPGTSSGQRLRLRGQGIRTDKATGDLLVIAKIVAPKELSEPDTRALQDLAGRLPNPRSGPPWSAHA